ARVGPAAPRRCPAVKDYAAASVKTASPPRRRRRRRDRAKPAPGAAAVRAARRGSLTRTADAIVTRRAHERRSASSFRVGSGEIGLEAVDAGEKPAGRRALRRARRRRSRRPPVVL